MRREIALVATLLCCNAAAAEIHVSKPQVQPRNSAPYHRPAPVPKECEQLYRSPWVDALCNVITRGRPQASGDILALPAHGTADAKAAGVACIGGLAMRRLPNGWEQIRDGNANFVRCVDR